MKSLSHPAAVIRGVAEGRLRAGDLRVLAVVLATELAARAGITFGTIPGARRRIARLRPVLNVMLGPARDDRVLRTLDAIERRGVGTCLTRALAAEGLLASAGSTTLVIGVAQSGSTSRLDAHAWLEVDRRIVVGGASSTSRYRPFMAWNSERR